MLENGPASLARWQDKGLLLDRAVRQDWRLLEIDEKLLQEVIYNGVTIKGSADQEAVLCTGKATYALKHVETTNTLYMVPSSDSSCQTDTGKVCVKATAAAHLEMSQMAPQLKDLDAVLQDTELRGEDEGTSTSGRDSRPPMTFDELLSTTQASAAELEVALQERGALEYDGCWRLMSGALLGDTLEVLLLTAAQHGWGSCIPLAEAGQAMSTDGFDPRLTVHCARLHAQPDRTADDAVTLDTRKVCLHFARKLLTERKQWPLDDFKEAWQSSIPEGMTVDRAMLKGEALIEGSGGAEESLISLSIAKLPSDPCARFARLFALRPRWVLPDLEPYLADLQIPGRSAEALLLTYARASQDQANGPVLYSAR
ncbi:g3876 [Coccomyxa viridis]|uniref:G3876 protein n=1 Tax=Coccomyxa viridis TaxID=1274662 RepID=A0ABP1FNW8_9CHLO